MPSTIRRGSTGKDVTQCQEDLTRHGYSCGADGIFGPNTEAQVKKFQSTSELVADGVVGPNTWAILSLPGPLWDEDTSDPVTWDPDPDTGDTEEAPKRGWADWNKRFVPLLGPSMEATYSLRSAQMPKFPPGVTFLPSKYEGESRTNCSLFTAYFVGNGMGIGFNLDQWNEWQVAKGGDESKYSGYGPKVCADWNVGTLMPAGAVPKDGVYLVQSFTEWPRGHSWLVLDYDEPTGKILTLESNTSGTGLNGVGFMGLGPIRSTNAGDWKNRVRSTWESRTKNYGQIHMARLEINHQTVLDWVSSQ